MESIAAVMFPGQRGIQQDLVQQVIAGKAKPEDFVDLRFVDEMKKSGFVDKLYGRK